MGSMKFQVLKRHPIYSIYFWKIYPLQKSQWKTAMKMKRGLKYWGNILGMIGVSLSAQITKNTSPNLNFSFFFEDLSQLNTLKLVCLQNFRSIIAGSSTCWHATAPPIILGRAAIKNVDTKKTCNVRFLYRKNQADVGIEKSSTLFKIHSMFFCIHHCFVTCLFVADWDSYLKEQNHLVISLRTSMSSILVLHILHVKPREFSLGLAFSLVRVHAGNQRLKNTSLQKTSKERPLHWQPKNCIVTHVIREISKLPYVCIVWFPPKWVV